jgi:putative transposase
MDYVHFNPVKHSHVAHARDWPFSTFHRLVEQGVYERDWGSSLGDFDSREFGE